MQIFVNSKSREVPDAQSVRQLIELLELTQKRVAVEVNAELVPKGHWNDTQLKPGDRVEIVSFVGGG